nr:MAG TPA: hypothetical protein [Bacteriophage sp.]
MHQPKIQLSLDLLHHQPIHWVHLYLCHDYL